jgi:hypothetical protein
MPAWLRTKDDGASTPRPSSHFDPDGELVASGSGFYTLPAAVGDAREHGFRGEFTLGEDGPVWRRFDDWATLSANGDTAPS